MAFFKNIFGNGKSDSTASNSSPPKGEMSIEEIESIFKAYIEPTGQSIFIKNPLQFRQKIDIGGDTIYVSLLSTAISDKRIPASYYILMKGLDVYMTKIDYDKGTPFLYLPDAFNCGKATATLYEFQKYELNTSYVDYKGFYHA